MWRAIQRASPLLTTFQRNAASKSARFTGGFADSKLGNFSTKLIGFKVSYACRDATFERLLCSKATASSENDAQTKHTATEEVTEEIERIPVPTGIPTDEVRIYEIKDSSRSFKELPGLDCLFGVHGPEEVWAPKGLVKGHGAGGGKYAVIAAAGAQFKVMEGDVMYTSRVMGEVNSTFIFDDVLVIGAVDWTILGRPTIRDAIVVATIEEQARSGKIYITKFKKRTGYKRRMGHRQKITRFRINEIRYELPDASRLVEHEPLFDPRIHPPNFQFRL